MGRFFGLATLIIGGVIIADLVIHANSTATVANAAGKDLITPTYSALLGK